MSSFAAVSTPFAIAQGGHPLNLAPLAMLKRRIDSKSVRVSGMQCGGRAVAWLLRFEALVRQAFVYSLCHVTCPGVTGANLSPNPSRHCCHRYQQQMLAGVQAKQPLKIAATQM